MGFKYCMIYSEFRVFLSIKCLNLDKIPFALFKLIAVSEICCFQLRFSSIFIPRYFTEFVGQNRFPLSFSFNGTSVSFFDDLNKTTSVLLTFRKILFAFSQLVRLSLG